MKSFLLPFTWVIAELKTFLHHELFLRNLCLASLKISSCISSCKKCLFLFYLERSLFVFSWVFVTLFLFILINHKMCQKRKMHSFLLNSDKDQNFSLFLLPFRISEAFFFSDLCDYCYFQIALNSSGTLLILKWNLASLSSSTVRELYKSSHTLSWVLQSLFCSQLLFIWTIIHILVSHHTHFPLHLEHHFLLFLHLVSP